MSFSAWRRWLSSQRPGRAAKERRFYRPTLEALEDRTTVSTIYGLLPGNVLIRFESANPSQTSTIGTVTGLGANETIRGIDFRPRTGQLYASTVVTGSAANSVIRTYTINPLNGQASLVGQTAAALAGAGDVPTGYDFNPTVDRIRYVNTNDENARLNPNNGALAANDTDLTPAGTSDIIAEAYDRNFDRQFIPAPPAAPNNNSIPTTLYAINRNNSMLVRQGGVDGTPSPNGGVISNVGALGFTLNGIFDGGFDITAGAGLGQAFAALTSGVDNLTRLYRINLGNGAATSLGLIGNGLTPVISIGIVPDSTVVVGSGAGPVGDVRVFDGFTGALRHGLVPFPGFAGGVRVASGDVTGDGVADTIVGAGPGAPGGHVKVFNGLNGAEVRSFFTFSGYSGGVNVAAGDVNADGFDDIVVGAGGAHFGGHVKVFNGRDGAELASFFAFSGFGGGVSVAAADFDLNGTADLVVGAAGAHLGGHVKIFDGQGQPFVPVPVAGVTPPPTIPNSFFAFPGFGGAVFVAAGDINGDGRPEIITGVGPGAGPHVKAFSGTNGAQIASFFAYESNFSGGVFVAAADVNRDGRYEIRTTPGPGRPVDVRSFNAAQQQLNSFTTFSGFGGGAFIGGARNI